MEIKVEHHFDLPRIVVSIINQQLYYQIYLYATPYKKFTDLQEAKMVKAQLDKNCYIKINSKYEKVFDENMVVVADFRTM